MARLLKCQSIPPRAEVIPIGVHLINHVDLPLSIVFLQPLFPAYRFVNPTKFFVIDKFRHIVLIGKPLVPFHFMLKYSTHHIVSYTNIKHAVVLVGKQVDVNVLLFTPQDIHRGGGSVF